MFLDRFKDGHMRLVPQFRDDLVRFPLSPPDSDMMRKSCPVEVCHVRLFWIEQLMVVCLERSCVLPYRPNQPFPSVATHLDIGSTFVHSREHALTCHQNNPSFRISILDAQSFPEIASLCSEKPRAGGTKALFVASLLYFFHAIGSQL